MVAINRADSQPTGVIIVLGDITATEPLAIVYLADAQVIAQELGLTIDFITASFSTYEGQIVGVDKDGNVVVMFDIASGQWRPAAPPTPEPTSTPDATEALRQHPWEVRYTAGTNGELTAQYYNDKSQEVVSVVAPEIENLQKSIWEAPDGRQLIIYQDTANTHGLAKYRYPYNPETGQYFPEGTIAWLEPKLLVNYPDGKAVRGGIVMVPEFQAQRQAQVPAAEKLKGKWRIGLPFSQAPAKTLNGEMIVGPWSGWSGILDIDFPITGNGIVVVNPLIGDQLVTNQANSSDGSAPVYLKNLQLSGLVPQGFDAVVFSMPIPKNAVVNPKFISNERPAFSTIGDVLVIEISGVIRNRNGSTYQLGVNVSAPSGLWEPFTLDNSFDTISGQMAITAPRQ